MRNTIFTIVFIASVLFINLFSASAKVVSNDVIQDLFQITDEYCQHKFILTDKENAAAFQYLVSKIRETQTIHISIDFQNGKIRFFEPQIGVHVMIAPRFIEVKDTELTSEYEAVLKRLNNNLFRNKYDKNQALNGDFTISLASWTYPNATRDQIILDYRVTLENKDTHQPETAEFDGKATVKY